MTPSVELRPYWKPLYLHPAPIPEGWVMVPKEPTVGMAKAADDSLLYVWKGVERAKFIRAYKTMIAAAPKPENA